MIKRGNTDVIVRLLLLLVASYLELDEYGATPAVADIYSPPHIEFCIDEIT